MTKLIKKIFLLGVGMLFCLSLASNVFATEKTGNISTGLDTGVDITTHNCSSLTVTNGTVAAYPTCTITCDTGYNKSGNSCVRRSTGGGGGGSSSLPETPVVATSTSNVIAGCGSRTTGFDTTTGKSCVGNTGETPTISRMIPGCDGRIAGFSVTTGASCVGNVVSGGTNSPATPTITRSEGKFIFTMNLKFGMTNNEVKELQKFLITKNYFKGNATGYFGTVTLASVKAFQKANGLTADGVVGLVTRALLNK